MLSEQELEKARNVLADMEEPVTLIVVSDSSELSKQFEEFASSMKFDKINVERREGEPAIVLKKGESEINYMAIPTGMEFEPFLKTIVGLSKNHADLDEKNLSRVKEIENEMEVTTFVTQFCPHCGRVVEKVNAIPSQIRK
jgi:alkyl hydroperoxide reductase subunit AhpF